MKKILALCSAALMLAACNNSSNPPAPQAPAEGGMKIAYVDTDTLMAKYQYAIDMTEELLAYKDQLETNGRSQIKKFQEDYQNYLKNGDKMTLSQQQKTETELKARGERMQTLEAEYSSQIMEHQMEENTKLLNAIFAFIREYNNEKLHYDLILRKSFNDTPVLYANPALDITQEILDGLNEEYRQVKGK
ncbi:MAG: OmpH family outer membrane protein [Bacteroidales bacterium]|nr:OmpH family outer membrane protein [Bacteroidales bacterium]